MMELEMERLLPDLPRHLFDAIELVLLYGDE